MAGALNQRQIISLLDADPDLGIDLDEQNAALARRRALATVMEIEPPRWDPTELREVDGKGWLGLFMLEGLLIRQVTVGKRMACELFGPGDIFRPWDADGEYEPLPVTVEWLVLQPTRLAMLDAAFTVRIARWPAITSRLVGRIAQRARYLALAQAVTHLPRAYARLLILFWLLAERWGKVGPDGIHICLPLTHDILAMLVGAHRPTVTIAIQRLERAGLLHRERRDRWLLTNQAIEALDHPESLELIDGEDGAVRPLTRGTGHPRVGDSIADEHER
ncbi:MAG TPA: helix-turn-helix domain-containing protein [Solirubrobacteraceae bacterium]|nr:helix-turn-helix domain-containing protein [Solirubrobacteraceae bacterium]